MYSLPSASKMCEPWPRAMNRLGAGIHQPHHFDRGHGVDDGIGELDLLFGGRPEAGADGERAFQRLENLRMPVAEQQRSPATDVIDVLVAVGIEDVRALAARDESRLAAYAAECAHRRIHP